MAIMPSIRRIVMSTQEYPNQVTLMGEVSSDLYYKKIGDNDNSLCRFKVKTVEKFPSQEGKERQNISNHQIISWGKVADRVNTNFKAGSPIVVKGRLRNSKYTDKEGVEQFSTAVEAIYVTSEL